MSDIAGARNIIKEIAEALRDVGLHDLANKALDAEAMMYRRKLKKRKASVHSEPMTKEKVLAIRADIFSSSGLPDQTLADKHRVNPGRIADVRAGKYNHLLIG